MFNPPDDYVILDLEATGVVGDIHIVQFGFGLVKKRQMEHVIGFTLKLPPEAIMSPEAFKKHGFTREHLEETGIIPAEGVAAIHTALMGLKNYPFVGHNIIGFDLRVLEENFKRYKLPPAWFALDNVLDTGAIFKAYQLGWKQRESETSALFMRHVREKHAKGVRWALDFCLEHFKLKQGGKNHDASEDVKRVYRVFEALRAKNVFGAVFR